MFGPNMHKKGLSVRMDHMQNGKQVFVQKQLTKADHKFSKKFYFTTY